MWFAFYVICLLEQDAERRQWNASVTNANLAASAARSARISTFMKQEAPALVKVFGTQVVNR